MIERGVLIVITGLYNRTLVGKRHSPSLAGQYGLPGGTIELNEKPADTAKRHLLKETGITAKELVFDGVVDEYCRNEAGQPSIFIHYVFAANLPRGAQVKNVDPGKCARWEWITRRDFKLLVPSHRAAIDVYASPHLREVGYP
jgi:ADP-ribose pyrophosphatase YjhB (NUDIX family)